MSRILLALPISAVIMLLIACGYGPGDPGKLCSSSFYGNAIYHDDVESIRKEIDRGADINARCEDDSTPLHLAVSQGPFMAAYPDPDTSAAAHTEIVRLLLVNGADINARNYREFTPLHRATINYHPYVILLLIEYGADVNAQNNREQLSPLHRAMLYSENPRTVELLLIHGADPNATDWLGRTPLHELAFGGISTTTQIQHARLLIEYGADLNSNEHRLTPCENYIGTTRVNSELRNLLCR